MARLHVIDPSVALALCVDCNANISDRRDFLHAMQLHVVSGPHVREDSLWFQVQVLTQTTLDLGSGFASSPRRIVGHIKLFRDGKILKHDLKYEVRSSYYENYPVATR